MSCAAKPISTMATIFISSPSSILTSKITHQHQPISTPLKPITLHLSNNPTPSLKIFSLHKKTQPFSRFSRFQRFSSLSILESSQDDDLSKSYLTLQKDDDQDEEDVSQEIENERDDIVMSGESDDVSGGDGDVSGEVEDEEEEVLVQPLEEAKIFVGNLPYDVDSEQLAALFQQAGVVDIVEVIYNRETDQSRGFGFVTMNTVEEAEKAVEMLHRYELGGRYLTVNKASPKGSRPERVERSPQNSGPSYRVYVGNLPWDVDDVRLEQLFSEHGKVVDARVVYDRDSGRSRGFGFVTMSSESELNDAIENLDGQSMGGRALRVNVAEEKPRRY